METTHPCISSEPKLNLGVRSKPQVHACRFACVLCLSPRQMPLALAQDPDESRLASVASQEPDESCSLDIDQLSRVQIVLATLTSTQTRLVPAKMTVIDTAAISQSGARSLNELLEIYTPNAQLMAHNTHWDHFGIRGIISDRDDKYQLRVKGKVMNNRYFSGAQSDRDLSMFNDLQTVTVVHGPGSASYGAGALAGVLNLEVSTSHDQYLYLLWFCDDYGNDLVNWNASRSSPLGYTLADPGYDAANRSSAYWNTVQEYHASKRLSIRVDAFNILGWADITLNKRLYYFRSSDYFEEAPFVAISEKLSF